MALMDRVLSVFAPFYCLSCGHEGQILCTFCLADCLLNVPSRCYRCQVATVDFDVCSKCRPQVALSKVRVRTNYHNIAEQLIRKFKYNHASVLANLIGDEIEATVPLIDKDTLVVAVPTASLRRRQRGYDHARLIANRVARKQNLQIITPIARLSQSRQVGASRRQRFEQLKDAFLITKPRQVVGRKILLIDDVVTTGATLERVAKLLKQVGAKRVEAAVFAQRF
jgi:competence protein ComFC